VYERTRKEGKSEMRIDVLSTQAQRVARAAQTGMVATAAKAVATAERAPTPARQVAGFAAIAGVAYGVLYGINELEQSLWGEFLFAFAVVALAMWAVGRLIPRRWWRRLRVRPPRIWQAPIVSLALLAAVPIAITYWPFGAAVLGLSWLVAFGVCTRTRLSRGAAVWIGMGVGLIVIPFAPVADAYLREERVPSATRTSPVPGGERLALSFRPQLFFDSGERFEPLDIGAAIATEDVRMCRYGRIGEPCDDVTQATQFDEQFDYLEIDGDPLRAGERPGGPDSAYYYRVVSNQELVYVDYWWFYALNPSPLERRGFCAAGFRLPSISCFEHAADWEGVTVVLGQCQSDRPCVKVGNRSYGPLKVHYAQHNHVVPYTWEDLELRWRDLPTSVKLQATGDRPLVFVARNSHASYPKTGDKLTDGPFDGLRAWTNNATCDGCLHQLPITADGDPALWNAFSGPWGAQKCILFGTYCDRSKAPTAPSRQARYQDPFHTR
jgi:hypothetical protein